MAARQHRVEEQDEAGPSEATTRRRQAQPEEPVVSGEDTQVKLQELMAQQTNALRSELARLDKVAVSLSESLTALGHRVKRLEDGNPYI